MKLMINFIIGTISSICTGLISSYIYDKIKNHLSICHRKSCLECKFKLRFKLTKK